MEQSINSDLIRGHIDTIILRSLSDGDKFPQEISDYVFKISNENYSINQATLYSSLKRLETTKLLRSYWQDSSSGRRKFFSLTQLGRDCIEKKVQEWSQSREIIDVLMGVPVQKTLIYSKIAPQNVLTTESTTTNAIQPSTPIASIETDKIDQKTESFIDKTNVEKVEFAQSKDEKEIKDVNYKGILGNLLSSSTVKKESKPISPIIETETEKISEQQPIVCEKEDKAKFNDIIETTKYNSDTLNNNRIDFGDLSLKASKEGYKLRISSKESARRKEGILINKIDTIASWFAFILFAVAMVLISSVNNSSPLIYHYLLLVIIPFYNTVKLLLNNKKVSSKKITKDSILISLVVIFNLILITCALNFFFNVDMFNTRLITATLILPNVAFLCGLIFFIIRYYLSNRSKYNYSK